MPAAGRYGGHIVAGHADGVGTITRIRRDDTAVWYTVRAEPALLRYIVEKGSVTIDGISLTVAQTDTVSFSVSVIPHTLRVTVLGNAAWGTVSIWKQISLQNIWKSWYIQPQDTLRKRSRVLLRRNICHVTVSRTV